MDANSKLILKQAKILFHVDFISENTMGGSGNRIFEVQKEDASCILKVSEYSPVNEKHTEMELKWVEYLSIHMSGVSRPVRSSHHKLYEIVLVEDKKYILSLQEKAKGKLVDTNNPSECNEELYYNLGVLMGKMHKLTTAYEGNVINPYFVWDNDKYSWRGKVPIKDEEVLLFDQKYKDQINTLPTSKDSYGIIHYDIHTNNFFVANNNITIFDFDACQFNWYAADIASTLFFMVQVGAGPLTHQSEKERSAFAESFLIAYLKGYTKTNVLSAYWLHTFDVFMKYQMIDEYRSAQDYLKEELGDQHQYYLDWFKNRIINNIPYVTINYQTVMDSVPGIVKD